MTTRPIPFPIILGVTGHRDMLPDAAPAVRATLVRVLNGVKRQFGADAVFVLTALAPGADQLAAEVAVSPEVGLKLIAVAPMPMADYRAKFGADTAALDRFDRYWREAELRLELPWVDPPGEGRSDKLQYEQLGAVLSRYSHLLLALWDGQHPWSDLPPGQREDERGGTAHVLHMRRSNEHAGQGFRDSRLFQGAASRLDPARGSPALHVMTPRRKNAGQSLGGAAGDCVLHALNTDRRLSEAAQEAVIGAMPEETRQEFEQIIALNNTLRGFGRVDCDLHARQIDDLCTGCAAHDLPGNPGEHLASLRNLQAGADTAAQGFQRLLLGDFLPARGMRHMASRGRAAAHNGRIPGPGMLFVFAAMVPATVLLFELYANLWRSPWVFAAYVAVPFVGMALYHGVVRQRAWQNHFQDYRALAEAMRVQIFWSCSALPRAVSDHYLRLQRDELGWVQFALRGPALWALALALEIREPWRPMVNACWINHQCTFFLADEKSLGRVELNRGAQERSEKWADRYFGAGLGLSVLLLVLQIAAIRFPWAARAADLSRDWLLTLIATAGGIAAAFVISSERRAYEAHAHSYHALGGIFAKARSEAENSPCADNDEEYRQLIFDLGREALAENASWLQDHRRRKIEHHRGG